MGNTLNQLSPEKASSLATLSFAGADIQKRILARRITDLRFEARGTGDIQSDFGLAKPMLVFSSPNLSGLLTGTGEAPSGSSWGLYFDPAVIIANQGSAGDQTGYDFSVAGFSTGIDYRVRKDLLVGLATGYNHTEASFHDNGAARSGATRCPSPLTSLTCPIPFTSTARWDIL